MSRATNLSSNAKSSTNAAYEGLCFVVWRAAGAPRITKKWYVGRDQQKNHVEITLGFQYEGAKGNHHAPPTRANK